MSDNGIKRRDLLMVPVDQIVVNNESNYTDSERGDIASLAGSIATEGIQNPLKCYKNSDGKLVLQSGFRRMAAVRLINGNKKIMQPIERVPVILEDRYANEADRDVRQILENAHREDATPIEKAQIYNKLITVHGLEIEDVARRIGEDVNTIKRYLTLLQASQPVRKALENGKIGMTAAAQIVKKNPEDAQAQKEDLEIAVAASGGKKAKSRVVQKMTQKQGPRQRTKTFAQAKKALDDIRAFMKDNTLADEIKTRYEAYLGSVKWFLSAGKAPWE